MNKTKTPPCIGHDQETEVLEDMDTIMDTLIEDLMTAQNVIVLHNDDVNSFDLVIACLIAYCDKGYEEAQQTALIIHNKGKCIVNDYFDDLGSDTSLDTSWPDTRWP
jgi:ATP-dependent Clp protease adapter protein ClpS